MLYAKVGRYGEAEGLFQRSVTVLEHRLGPTHLAIAAVLNNLASLYSDLGRYGEAEPSYKRSLAIIEQTAGPNSPPAAKILRALDDLHRKQGRLGEEDAPATRTGQDPNGALR